MSAYDDAIRLHLKRLARMHDDAKVSRYSIRAEGLDDIEVVLVRRPTTEQRARFDAAWEGFDDEEMTDS